MKKRLIQFALILGLMVLTCAAAQATETPESGFRNLSIEAAYQDLVELAPLTASGGSVSPDSNGNYPGAAKMEAVYRNPQSNSEYLLIVLTDDQAPNVDNMAYIDQKTASGAEVTFTIYPKAQTVASVTYNVYMSSNADAGEEATGVTEYVKVASFEYYGKAAEPDVIMGDVNGDTEADTSDAVMILQKVVRMIEFDSQQQKAGDVNKDGDADTSDAVMILQYVVRMIDSLG